MCRNIKPLFNFEPPATKNEVHEAAFHGAVEDIEKIVRKMLKQLETNAPPKDREVEAAKHRERSNLRFPERASA